MKTAEDYTAMPYRMEIVEDRTDGGYAVSFPELPGCLTSGETVESAVENAKDAKRAWLDAAVEDGIEIREPDEMGGDAYRIEVRVPRSLNRWSGTRAARASRPGSRACASSPTA